MEGRNILRRKKLARSKLKWAGHIERMGDEKLAKRSDTQKMEGKGRRGRPRMRWEDCVKRDLERVGREWGTTAKYGSRRLTVDRERSDKNVREEQATVTLARPHP